MKISPLGTSSGKPTLHRNVSATAVVGDGEWWLFDCGEGTQMQMARAGLSPQKLAGIFISHLHGDHFNGLPGLLSSMSLDCRTKELTLVGPAGIGEYLELLSGLKICYVNYPLDLREFDAAHFRGRARERVFESERFTVTTCPIDHRIFTLGYRLEEKTKPGRFDLEAARWDIPAARMKMKTPHIVPLSVQAVNLLRTLHLITGHSVMLFPGERDHEKSMSNNTILKALERMGYKGRMTGHGFRGVASTLLHEMGFDHAHIELQLAHQERNEVSAAYNHATYLKQRAAMMQHWSDYLDTCVMGKVVPIRRTAT